MDQLPAILPLLVPILGILLGFVVLTGIFIVQPLVKALSKLGERPDALAGDSATGAELRALARRIESIENSLARIEEKGRFDRELGAGAESAGSMSRRASSAPPDTRGGDRG